MRRLVFLIGVCCGAVVLPPAGIAAAQSTYLDNFVSATYSGSNGTVSWTSSPWIETDSAGGGAAGGNLFVVTASGCPQGSCLNVSAVNTSNSIYREADLLVPPPPRHCRTPTAMIAPPVRWLPRSPTTAGRTGRRSRLTRAKACPSTQNFTLTQFTSTTRLRFSVTAIGGAILYVDQVQFAFSTGPTPTPTRTPTGTGTPTPTNTPTGTATSTPAGPTGTPTPTPTGPTATPTSTVVHTPNPLPLPLDKKMNMIRCSTCHDMHQGAGAGMLLRTGNVNALCTDCHTLADTTTPAAHLNPSTGALWPGPRYGTLFPRVTDAAQRGFCTNCHQSHGWPDGANPSQDYPTLLANREEHLCFACHDGSVLAKNVLLQFTKSYRHPTTDYSGRHSLTEGGNSTAFGVTNRHAECDDCHNSHVASADTTAPVAPAASNRLRGVARVAVTNGAAGTIPTYTYLGPADTTAPIAEYQICFKCHSSWTTQPAGQADTAVVFNPNNPSYHPVEAAGRNTNINPNAFVNGWTGASTMYCTDCHGSDDVTVRGPHGSQNPYLLTQTSIASSGRRTMASTEECFSCHSFDTYANTSSSSTVQNYSRFGSGSNGHAGHVVGHRAPCYACHDSHGSATQPHLIVIGRNPGINSYTETASGGSCSPTCHGRESYTVRYAR